MEMISHYVPLADSYPETMRFCMQNHLSGRSIFCRTHTNKVSTPSQTSICMKEIMSGMPHPQSPSFNPVNTTGSQPFGAAPPPTKLNFLAGMTDMTMEDTTMMIPRNMDLHTSSPLLFPTRAPEHGYMPPMAYTPNIPHYPMGPMWYPGAGSIGGFANPYLHNPPLVTITYMKPDSIGDLPTTESPGFEYRPEFKAILHLDNCANCMQYGFHLLTQSNRVNFQHAVSTCRNTVTKLLHNEINKLNKELQECKSTLEGSHKLVASQQGKHNDDLLDNYLTLSRHTKDMDWQPYWQPGSPVRGLHHQSPPRTGP